MDKPILCIVIPCYNEQDVLPITNELFVNKIEQLVRNKLISENSKILYVDDGSTDDTWNIIKKISQGNNYVMGISQSRNRGHQNALIAGLMEAKNFCDISISIDCDGQDDIDAMNKMIEEYINGVDIVYGVRRNRDTDKFLKRITAQGYYKLLKHLGVEIVYNHADYRLLSSRVLKELEAYNEVNLFLRGIIPLVGFKSTSVYYDRLERVGGKTHYSPAKMISFAIDGITSLSIRPLRLITSIGFLIAILGFIGAIWAVVTELSGNAVTGWASTICIVSFLGGIQLVCLGIIGEYVGKIYMEVKHRPRYIIKDKVGNDETKI